MRALPYVVTARTQSVCMAMTECKHTCLYNTRHTRISCDFHYSRVRVAWLFVITSCASISNLCSELSWAADFRSFVQTPIMRYITGSFTEIYLLLLTV